MRSRSRLTSSSAISRHAASGWSVSASIAANASPTRCTNDFQCVVARACARARLTPPKLVWIGEDALDDADDILDSLDDCSTGILVEADSKPIRGQADAARAHQPSLGCQTRVTLDACAMDENASPAKFRHQLLIAHRRQFPPRTAEPFEGTTGDRRPAVRSANSHDVDILLWFIGDIDAPPLVQNRCRHAGRDERIGDGRRIRPNPEAERIDRPALLGKADRVNIDFERLDVSPSRREGPAESPGGPIAR